MRARGTVVALLLLTGTAAVAPILAEGTSDGFQPAFSTDGGNDWWIEVDVDSNEPLAGVHARVDSGDWIELEHQDWGEWAKSTHVPDGSVVEFQATSTDGDQATSQAYRWPSGEPAHLDSFEAGFATDGGNEWWVEVAVTTNQPLAGVDARIDGGDWRALDRKHWGEWAASFHVPDGSVVTFRATSTAGAQATSQAYQWPSGEPATDKGFEARFATDGGNDWWIEVAVTANQPLAGVDARIDGGDWFALDLQDWGEWAKSTHVPDGSTVSFRATSDEGQRTHSATYRWPEGEETSSPATMDAAFGPKAGNAWWVETYVVTDGSIATVEARADGGPWHDMQLRDWGAWTASFHVPDGSVVTFRATDEAGAVDTSVGFLWPDAEPAANPDGEWPTVGSYADYHMHGGGPTAEYKYEIEALFVHDDDGWVVRCEGYRQDPGGRQPVFDHARNAPPAGPSPVSIHQTVDVEQGGCHQGAYKDLTVEEKRTYDTRRDGDPVTVSTWFADRTADCRCLGWEASWETETDLVTEWWRGGRTGDVGELEDTDAPIGEG